jgi:hypothetical protein
VGTSSTQYIREIKVVAGEIYPNVTQGVVLSATVAGARTVTFSN